MASKSLGTLTLDLVAKIGGFEQGMDKAARKSKKTSADISKHAGMIGAAIGASAVAAVAGIALIVNKQRDLIDQQAKAAQQLDTTYTSMANLQRAGELGGVGIGKIEAASRQLNLNIGRAIQGTDAQVEAFERLGLSAQDIADMPLDKRISTINAALRDNVQASERAAVAAELFGAKNGSAIQQLDPDTIAEAARQVEIFGLNLSDVDAAKVEMANDAMSTFGLITDGIGKQLTVELAPILKAVGEEFLNTADEAGGLGNQVESAVQKSVNSLAFVMDAVDGVGVVFGTVGRTVALIVLNMNEQIYEMADSIYNGPIDAFNEMLDLASRLPGVDIEPRGLTGAGQKIRTELETIRGAIAEGESDLQDYLNSPLAGERMRMAYQAAQEAGKSAAESTVAAREAAHALGEAYSEAGEEGKKAADKAAKGAQKAAEAIDAQVTALERAALTWHMDADATKLWILEADGATESQLSLARAHLETVANLELSKEAQESYADLLKDLRTDEEVLTDQMRERLKVLDAMSRLTDDQRMETAGRIAGAGTSDAPEYGGLDAVIGGPFGELNKIDEAEEKLQDWYSTQLEMLETFRAERADLAATWDEEELALKQQHEDELAKIEQARQIAQMAAGEEYFGNMADAAKVFFGEQSSLYRAAFAIEKSYAIAKALMNVPKSYSDAFAAVVGIPIVGPALAPAAGVAAAAAQVAQAAAIGNVSLGQAHEGLDQVPQTGPYTLLKGERVTTAETSAKLDATLDRVGKDGRGGGAPIVNLYEDSSRAGQVDSRQEDGKSVIDIFVSDLMGDGRSQKAISQKFGMQGVGR